MQALAAAGLQPAVHAIGDAANRAVLDAIENASQNAPELVRLRPRIEHVQVISPADLKRVSSLGAIASMQPTHATSDMPWAEARLGSARLAGAYAWRSLLESGAVLAFGSDAPVESPDPRLGLFAAVTRRSPSGAPTGGWMPGQRLTVDQALEAFSAGAAAAVGREGELGRLAPGALCDITVFDRDPRAVPAKEILALVVTETIVGGSVVYPAPRR
jgi:predicted amidohydrolase YtcJ